LVDIMERSVFNGENNERRTTTRMRTAGRPKFDISRDQLVYLIDGVQGSGEIAAVTSFKSISKRVKIESRTSSC
jgi:hypothetical protein